MNFFFIEMESVTLHGTYMHRFTTCTSAKFTGVRCTKILSPSLLHVQ